MSEKPQSLILETLKGKVSAPQETVSHKVGEEGKRVTVSIIEEGSGLAGIEWGAEFRTFAGLFNHILTTARVATYLACELQKKGEKVDPDALLNTVLVSHAGRRQWEEARAYPEIVVGVKEKASVDNTDIALDLLKKAGITPVIIENVEAHKFPHAYPWEKMDTWEKKLALYCDFRIGQDVTSVDECMEDLKRAVADGRITEELRLRTLDWAKERQKEIFSKLDIKPEDITNDFPKQPRWERYLRRLFMHDAEEGIFERLSELEGKLAAGEIDEEQIEEKFPQNTWWGRYARELFKAQKGKPYVQKAFKARGIERAIKFWRSLEQNEQVRKQNEYTPAFKD